MNLSLYITEKCREFSKRNEVYLYDLILAVQEFLQTHNAKEVTAFHDYHLQIELCHEASAGRPLRSESSNATGVYQGYSNVFNMQAVFAALLSHIGLQRHAKSDRSVSSLEWYRSRCCSS